MSITGYIKPCLLQIEIGGGLGQLKGKIWRIGLMGETFKIQNILSLTGALGNILA